LSLCGVSKTYHRSKVHTPALEQTSLKIQQGEFTALSGPSGSGKSTLLNIFGLLDQADEGTYLYNQTDVTKLSSAGRDKIRRNEIGFIFQDFNLIPVMSVQENVEYPLLLTGHSQKERTARVDDMLKKVGLLTYKQHRPDHISGGQQQRVAIARALIKNPRLIIADEPTANLDSDTSAQIIELIYNTSRLHKMTVLIATHDEQVAQRCDRVLVIKDGILQ